MFFKIKDIIQVLIENLNRRLIILIEKIGKDAGRDLVGCLGKDGGAGRNPDFHRRAGRRERQQVNVLECPGVGRLQGKLWSNKERQPQSGFPSVSVMKKLTGRYFRPFFINQIVPVIHLVQGRWPHIVKACKAEAIAQFNPLPEQLVFVGKIQNVHKSLAMGHGNVLLYVCSRPHGSGSYGFPWLKPLEIRRVPKFKNVFLVRNIGKIHTQAGILDTGYPFQLHFAG